MNLLSDAPQWLAWCENGPAVHHLTSFGRAVHHLTSLGRVGHHLTSIGTQKYIFKVCRPKWHPLTSSGAAHAFNFLHI